MADAHEIAMAVPELLVGEVLHLLELRRRGLHRVDAAPESTAGPQAQITAHELEELCDRVETLAGAPPFVKEIGKGVWAHYQRFGTVSQKQVNTLHKFLSGRKLG